MLEEIPGEGPQGEGEENFNASEEIWDLDGEATWRVYVLDLGHI